MADWAHMIYTNNASRISFDHRNGMTIDHLSLFTPGKSPEMIAITAIRYMWSAIDSDSFTPWFTQPVLFVVYVVTEGVIRALTRNQHGSSRRVLNSVFNARQLKWYDCSYQVWQFSVEVFLKPSALFIFIHSHRTECDSILQDVVGTRSYQMVSRLTQYSCYSLLTGHNHKTLICSHSSSFTWCFQYYDVGLVRHCVKNSII